MADGILKKAKERWFKAMCKTCAAHNKKAVKSAKKAGKKK